MTLPGMPGGPGRRPPAGAPTPPDPARADPEAVLSQALRAMAGGGKPSRGDRQSAPLPPARLSVLQIVLIAVIIGLLFGITAALITVLV